MPLNKNRNFRLQVLDKCLRDPVHSYTMQELLRVCNKALVRNGYPTVKLRTMQLDVKSLLQPPFNMVLDAKSWLAGCYRYADRNQKLDLLNLSNEEKCALERYDRGILSMRMLLKRHDIEIDPTGENKLIEAFNSDMAEGEFGQLLSEQRKENPRLVSLLLRRIKKLNIEELE